jgi:hypothetical protein
MKRNLIRYRTSQDRAEENEALIKDVFEELQAKTPSGIRYLALNLGEGRFVHFVETDENEAGPLSQLESFKTFQRGLKDRQIEPTAATNAAIIGDYRMLAK